MNIFALMKVKNRDKQRLNLKTVSSILSNSFIFCKKYGISLTSLKDLNAIIERYTQVREPVTSFYLLTKKNDSGASYNSLRLRINKLIDIDLIVNVSNAGNKMLLIPTDKAIREFKEIFNCVD